MAFGACSRCARLRPGDDRFVDPAEGHSPAATGPLGSLRWTWASIDGEDVCPECQTPLERRQAGWHIVALLEAEIERRGRDGVAPGEVEAALISHVLALRAELEATASAGGDAPGSVPAASSTGSAFGSDSLRTGPADAEPPDTSGGDPVREPPGATKLRVAMTGAFLTGCALVVRIAEYGKLQAALADALCRPGWLTADIGVEDGTYKSGGGFVKSLPLVIARREGHDLVGQLSYQLDGPDHARGAALARVAPGYNVEPKRVSIDVYDLGVAVLTAWFDVSAPEDEKPADVARTVMDLAWLRPGPRGASPLATALQEIARETVEQYGRAVHSATGVQIQRTWPGGIPATESGRLLWLHPIQVLEEPTPSKESTCRYAPVFRQTIDVDDGVFAPGVNWSVIAVARPDSDGADAAVKLTQRHWAYYALYMELDRALMGVLNFARLRGSPPRKELADDADKAFREYLRVMEARARLDSELSALGGDDLAIWQAISNVQCFDTLVGGVERKIDILRRLTQRRADEATAERERRITIWLGWLAALTIVTATIAGVAYLFGAVPAADGLTPLRIVAFVVACLGAAAVGWLAYRAGAERHETP